MQDLFSWVLVRRNIYFFLESNSTKLWKIRESVQSISDLLYRPKEKKRSVIEALEKNIKYYTMAGKSERQRWLIFFQPMPEKHESKQTKQGVSYYIFETESYTKCFTAIPRFYHSLASHQSQVVWNKKALSY